ncbi:Predicted arabinose efflux permease, MFS family [Thermoactinomyces sp. DSM 45891]|uniref:MFS transporter n=1 Tax=Thermoactinomyces sp. DSM 45891 TaxID=1761907 RepID=UPI00091CD3D5|nr:MFS transporter [Thermoactinomyces sp. DSM 45891]SFX26245.1 Predicted arabinose efflux permease, MFS family [Thermoactinomyces sp. DSM 45891]
MKKPFWLLFSADVLVVLGEAIGLFCIEVLLFQKTGSTGLMGSLVFCFVLPETVLRLLGTGFIDRFNRIKLMSTLNIIRGMVIGGLCISLFMGTFHIWLFFIAAMILGSCAALFLPTGMALIPNLVEKDQLVRGYSLLESFSSSARVSGPLVASFFIACSGAESGMWIFAGSVFLGSILIRFIKNPSQESLEKSTNNSTISFSQIKKDIGEGFSFFRQIPALTVVMLLAAITTMGMAMWFMLLVPYGQKVLHINYTQISLLSSLFFVGIICAAIITGWIGNVHSRSKFMMGSLISTGIFTCLISFTTNYYLALSLFFLLGMTMPFFNTHSQSIFAQLIPDSHLGRVMSVRLLLGQGSIPLGSLTGGWISEWFGTPSIFFIAGALSILAGIIGLLIPWLNQIDGNLDELASEIKEKFAPLPVQEKESA